MNKDPNWFLAMMEFKWTVQNIRRNFGVSTVIAEHIQHCFPTFKEACDIAAASHELCDQLGH